MYGVVLWSDKIGHRAVIWCEDHGDLVYFKAEAEPVCALPDMAPGDLVQFELSDKSRLRMARNPRLVAEEEYPTLAQELRQAGQADNFTVAPGGARSASKIVAFRSGGCAPQPAAAPGDRMARMRPPGR